MQLIKSVLFIIGFTSSTLALKCVVQFNSEGHFAKSELDAFECPIVGQQCVYAECVDQLGENKIWPSFVDCKLPEEVNCTQLTSECASQDGTSCCYTCNTDGCNQSWNCKKKPTTITTTTTTTTSTSTTPVTTTSTTTASATFTSISMASTEGTTEGTDGSSSIRCHNFWIRIFVFVFLFY